MSWRALAACAIAAILGACGGTEAPPANAPGFALDDPERVVAEDRLGPITFGDVDRYILALPAAQRWREGTPPAELYRTMTRRFALDRLLHDEAVLVGADQDPAFQATVRRLRRDAVVQQHLRDQASLRPTTEDEMRAFYEQHQQRFQRNEQREVFHIFQRFAEGADQAPVVAAMNALRQRAMDGESFELLAREASESETRHHGGRLGWVEPGHFPEDFDRVVFNLEIGVPSQVRKTRDGAHLFLVTNLLEKRNFSFADARKQITEELTRQRRDELWGEILAEIEPQPGSFIPSPEEITQILRSGDPNALLLRIGDTPLRLGELNARVAERRRALGPRRDPDLPWQLVQDFQRRELIFQHLQQRGQAQPDAETATSLEQTIRRRLIEHYAERKMAAFLDQQPDRVRAHYENNKMRFATPLRVRLRRLVVPRGEQAPALMARLERARADLDAGRLDLDQIAGETGGTVQELGPVTAAELQRVDDRALRFAFLLKPGEHSPPYQLANDLVLFQIVEREEPRPRPLARTRDRVIRDILENDAAGVLQELAQQMLDQAGFRTL